MDENQKDTDDVSEDEIDAYMRNQSVAYAGGKNPYSGFSPKEEVSSSSEPVKDNVLSIAKELKTPAAVAAGAVAAKKGLTESMLPKHIEGAAIEAEDAIRNLEKLARQRMEAESRARRLAGVEAARRNPSFVEGSMARRFPQPVSEPSPLSPAHWTGEAGSNYALKHGVNPAEIRQYPTPTSVQQEFIPRVGRAAERASAIMPGAMPWEGSPLILTPEQAAERAAQIKAESAPASAYDAYKGNVSSSLRARQEALAASAKARAESAAAAATSAGREAEHGARSAEKAVDQLKHYLIAKGWTTEMLDKSRSLKYFLPLMNAATRGAGAYMGVRDIADAIDMYEKQGMSPETAMTGASGLGGLAVASGNPSAARAGAVMMAPKIATDLIRNRDLQEAAERYLSVPPY